MALEQLPLLLLDEPGLVRVNEGWGRIAFVPRVAWEFLGPYFVVPTLSTRFLFPILKCGCPVLAFIARAGITHFITCSCSQVRVNEGWGGIAFLARVA
jgi:hypothetical protein